VGGVLGPGHPCGDVAVLLVSELFGNSVRHSGSGAPGETVAVAVRAGDGMVRVEVSDRSGPGAPELDPAGRMRKAAAGFSSLRASRRGGGGGGAAVGRLPGSSCRTADSSARRWTWH
jgi:anti-sigma regulatory factor (Ser/Thr protein kinase)